MRKDTFTKGVEVFHQKLVKATAKRGIPTEAAREAVQDMIVTQLETKKYTQFNGDKINNALFSYLRRATYWQLMNTLKRQEFESTTFLQLDESEEAANAKHEGQKKNILDHSDDAMQTDLCPFCHEGILNQYKACAVCHTILGQGKSRRGRLSINEADLASLPDLEKIIDVRHALDGLTAFEKKVINHCAIGNDTLDDLSTLTGVGRDSLWRVYVKAKQKLQVILAEYA